MKLCAQVPGSKNHGVQVPEIQIYVCYKYLEYKLTYLAIREYMTSQYVRLPGECPCLVTVAGTGPSLPQLIIPDWIQGFTSKPLVAEVFVSPISVSPPNMEVIFRTGRIWSCIDL